jgi:TRAP-type C4-dicarboxylate transport system permease small subunit
MSEPPNPERHAGEAPNQPPGRREPGSRWPEIVAAQVILVGFLALSTLQVVSRYVFDAPLVWTEELSANLLIWMTFLGSAAILRSDSHVRVELVEEFFGPRVARWLFALFDAVIIAFLICLVIGGWQLMSQLEYERTPALRIPIAWIVSIVPAASVVMIGYAVANMVRRLRRPGGDGDAG